MPASVPASTPSLSLLCTQQPTSSRSGCPTTPSIAARPTLPVAHWITRTAIAWPPSSREHVLLSRHPSTRGRAMILDRFRLDDRVAIVTGAGKGIGAGTAVALAEVGADVVLAARTEADLQRTAERVEAVGRRAVVVPTDVLERDQLE